MEKRLTMFLIIKGHSERVNKKNFRLINGVPLHEYFISQRSRFNIFIDTDSLEIFDFYKNNKQYPYVTPYMRKQEHIDIENNGSTSPAPLMIERFLNKFISDVNEPVVTSHITSPFLKDDTVFEACKLMDEHDSVSSVMSVQEFCVDGVGKNTKPINFDLEKIVKTQSLVPIGVLNGAFFILTKKTFLNNGLKRISDNHYYYAISDIEALDIDTEFNMKMAKIIAENNE